ncbi:MAG: hypothetical protein ACT4UQ_03740 [Gammaproteobacteria bacterium]
MPEILDLLTGQTERAVRLRSTTPFVGVLTARERRRIRRAFLPEFSAE